MKKENSKLKYFLYSRKSTESEDRQVLSIESQINALQEVVKRENLDVVEICTESKSAKKPGREVFNKMMNRIKAGEAQGILCWKLDRLARNPIDGGEIIWLIQQKVIQHIKTPERDYLPEDNVIMMSVEFGMANQFILDLSKNVKRGIKARAEKGWYPSKVPLGYLNDKLEKTIIIDKERFDLVRKIWDLMLTGAYTPPKILNIVNDEWGFKTRRYKREGDKSLSRSGIYTVLTNIFYTGMFKYGGVYYKGKHKPMITMEEFDKVQFLLGRKGKPRPKTHQFAYTGMIRCEECGCLYTAESHKKVIKSTGEIKEYTYYHCTRRKKDIDCSQRKSTTEEDLEKQIETEISKITILPEFRDWALEYLNSKNDKEITDRQKIYKNQQKTLNQTQNELDELTRMRYRKMIDDEFYEKEKSSLQEKIFKLKEKLRQTEDRAEKWLELTEKTFKFACYAHKAFLYGNFQTKKEILMTLGLNFSIKDGILNINLNEWFIPIKEKYPELEREYQRLELDKTPVYALNKAKSEALASLRARWCA